MDTVRAAFVGDYADGTVFPGAAVAVALGVFPVTVGTQLFHRAGA